jgi:hypothetical protein
VEGRSKTIRGGPLYVNVEQGTISLVPEAHAVRIGRAGMGVLRPSAVYVIDGQGVKRLPITRNISGMLSILGNLVWGPFQWWFFIGRKRKKP